MSGSSTLSLPRLTDRNAGRVPLSTVLETSLGDALLSKVGLRVSFVAPLVFSKLFLLFLTSTLLAFSKYSVTLASSISFCENLRFNKPIFSKSIKNLSKLG